MDSTSKYTAEYFIAKFEAIPGNKWITHKYKSLNGCCALGHCGADVGITTPESQALGVLIYNAYQGNLIIIDINDGNGSIATDMGTNPKQRVLNALTLIASGILNDV